MERRADEKGKPNVGPFSCGGVITIDNATLKLPRSGQYWAFAHYSRHVHRGAHVFATDGLGYDGAGRLVSHTGFRNPDGSYVVVLSNKGPEKQVQLLLGAQSLIRSAGRFRSNSALVMMHFPAD